MAKHLLSAVTLLLSCMTSSVWATPASETVLKLNTSVLRVHVNLPDGKRGFGSAVVIAKDQVVTSCHVVNDATDVAVVVDGKPYAATAIKPDWRHDLCILTVANLDVPVVKLGASESLKYEESLFTVGYPDEVQSPVNTYGVVQGLYPMDDSMIVRASSAFRLGASGGGAFDDAGKLVGIITVKSRGENAYYYYMPVEWVQALMSKPEQKLGLKSEKPFWAEAPKLRPYFMQVAHPYLKHDWQALLEVASQWVETEPNTAESWFHLAAAEFATKKYDKAEEHLKKVLSINHEHTLAIDYLAKLADKTAGFQATANNVALLN